MTGNTVYVLPNTMGGMLNIVASIIEHKPAEGMAAHVVFTDNANVHDTRFHGSLPGSTSQQVVSYRLPDENLHAVLRRLRRAIPPGPGVLVCNDLLELAMLHVWDPRRLVVQILHGDHAYYYDLATRHASVIDLFVTYSRAMHRKLLERLPERAPDILYLPYGVTLPPSRRRRRAGPIRAVFAGRIEHGQKGVLDLPQIDAAMQRRGVQVHWTLIGGGPDEEALRDTWRSDRVEWRGTLSRDALLATLCDFDVFVLPTRAEGLPVALVEAMGAGLVPVVSDIASGVPELIDDGVEGFRRPIGDVEAFADAIAALEADRDRLEAMSAAAFARVQPFNPSDRARAYEDLFRSWPSRMRIRQPRAAIPYGSRLDQPWIPNVVVQSVRGTVRRWKGSR